MTSKEMTILNKTLALCSFQGFHSTSMDAITAETGISKATIYKYFKTKENLIAQSLALYSDKSLHEINATFTDNSLSFKDKLNSRFDVLKKYVDQNPFNGCFFQFAYSEYCNEDDGISNVCVNYKEEKQKLLSKLLSDNGISDPLLKSIKAELIYNGLLATLQITKNVALIDIAREMFIDTILSNGVNLVQG